MDLKEFIKETISSIAEAATDLQEALGKADVVVNPPRAKDYGTSMREVYDPDDTEYRFRQIETINFDVALTASEESSAQGGGGLKVAWLGVGGSVGGEMADRAAAERVSRVTFSISIALPPSRHETESKKRLASEKAAWADEDARDAEAAERAFATRNKTTGY